MWWWANDAIVDVDEGDVVVFYFSEREIFDQTCRCMAGLRFITTRYIRFGTSYGCSMLRMEMLAIIEHISKEYLMILKGSLSAMKTRGVRCRRRKIVKFPTRHWKQDSVHD